MTLAEERIPADEAAAIADLVRHNLKTVRIDAGTAKRGQHAKHHGLAHGTLRVLDHLPDGFARGVFQPGSQYACHIRFSNGSQPDDREQDVRGMAIKLLEVPGAKLLPGRGDATEQDFILVDTPTYFAANMAEYLIFARHFTPVQALRGAGFAPLRRLRSGLGMATLSILHPRLSRAARAFVARRAGSPLALTYHSTTPYHLGPGRAVKYKLVAHAPDAAPVEDENGLSAALWAALGSHAARFDFGVVVQDDATTQPIENPTMDWEANGAEFVKLADLVLPQQDNTPEKAALAETIAFNPWMALPAHRPLGYVNRARREVYRALSRLRQRRTSGRRANSINGI